MPRNQEIPQTIEDSLDQIRAIEDPIRREKALSAARLFLESLANNGSVKNEIPEDQRSTVEHIEFVAKGVRNRFENDGQIYGFLDH